MGYTAGESVWSEARRVLKEGGIWDIRFKGSTSSSARRFIWALCPDPLTAAFGLHLSPITTCTGGLGKCDAIYWL